MNPSINYILKYFKLLLSEYQKLAQSRERQDSYKIVEIQTHLNKTNFVIQVAGKRAIFTATPEELAADDTILEQFSRKDVRLITYYACNERKQLPKYRINVSQYCDKLNKMIFTLQERGQKKSIRKTADEISLNDEFLTQMHQKDSHLIGYTTAMEQMLNVTKEQDQVASPHEEKS